MLDARACLLATLPDTPRWVETRSMLLAGWAEIFGAGASAADFVVRRGDLQFLSAIGNPAAATIERAVAQTPHTAELLARPEAADRLAALLPGWRHETAVIHVLPDSELPAPDPPRTQDATVVVRSMAVGEASRCRGLDDDVRREIEVALMATPVIAACIGDRPVAYCYAGAETETLWDVSIGTSAEFRRRGLAERCARKLIDHHAQRGRRPVWGAMRSNAASLGLAAKLGFLAVDEIVVFSRRP